MSENVSNEQPLPEEPGTGLSGPVEPQAAAPQQPASPVTPVTPAAPTGMPVPPAMPQAPSGPQVPSAPQVPSGAPQAPNAVPTAPQAPYSEAPVTPQMPNVAPQTPAAPSAWQPPAGAPPSPWAPGAAYPPSSAPTTGYPTAAYPTSHYPQPPFGGAGAAQPPYNVPISGTGPMPGIDPTTGTAPLPFYGTGPRPRSGRTKIAALGLAALIFAGLGGVGGAAIMHSFDSNNGTTITTSDGKTVIDNSPTLDRSSLAVVAAKVMPSVVSITTSSAEGSGVILSSDGYILTNNHVAQTASGQSVDITFSDGKTVKATLVGTDAKTDLAVFKAENVSGLTAATFGKSSEMQVGDSVLAIGSPLGLSGSVTSGIVSALNRTIDESSNNSQPQNPQDPFGQQSQQQQSQGPQIAGAIQTDAAINPGNSGGALVNLNGEVIGINTAIATSDGTDGNIGVGFAIPSDRAKEVATDIIDGKSVPHPQLGVEVSTANDNAGAQVSSVTAGSAAAKAGVQAGDVITAFNGQAVHTSDDLLNDIQTGMVGTTYTLTIDRNGQTKTVQVTLQEATN